jgi:hypothetical protein
MARINRTSNAKFLDARFAGRKQKRGLYKTGGAIGGAALGYTLGGIPGAVSGYELGSYLGEKKEKGEDVELKDLAGMGVNAGLNYALGHGLGSLIDYGLGAAASSALGNAAYIKKNVGGPYWSTTSPSWIPGAGNVTY